MLARMWSNRNSASITHRTAKWYSHIGTQFWQFLTRLHILLPYDPAIVLLGIYPNELKTDPHTKPARECTAALFIIAQT